MMGVKNLMVAVGVLLAVAVTSLNDSRAAELQVAVAPNFTAPAKEIAEAFTAKTGTPVALAFVVSGQAYTQISQGAPFEVWLSADAARPAKTVSDGTAVAGSEFTYAIGKLYVWSKNDKRVTSASSIESGAVIHIAIANPTAAPYGAAAMETLQHMGILDRVKDRIVTAADIAQAYQFAQSGNAEIAFVAYSQIATNPEGSRWEVPQELYTPIRQDAVLLKKGESDPAAAAFLDYLKGPEAGKIIAKYGYALK